MNPRILVRMVIVSIYAGLLSCLFVVEIPALPDELSVGTTSDYSPFYLFTCNYHGFVFWGSDHFAKYLPVVVEWLDRYPIFKTNRATKELFEV